MESLTRGGKGFFAVFSPGFLAPAGRIHIFPSLWLQEAAPGVLFGGKRSIFGGSRVKGAWIQLLDGFEPCAPSKAPPATGIFLFNGFSS